MFLILKLFYRWLLSLDDNFYRDPRTTMLPLVGSPWPMVAIICTYLLLVLKIGPRFMANRKPYNVKLPMQIYNTCQVAANLYVFITSMRYSYLQPNFSVICRGYDVTDVSEATMNLRYPAFVFYVSKYFDLLDTVFFVLRKKHNQISFLHVYHHSAMVYALWVYVTLIFGSHMTSVGILNSFVHICMYSYYFIAAMNLKIDLTPWKRRMTQVQIVQFLLLCSHFVPVLLNNYCGMDVFWVWMSFVQNLFMLLMFSDFYYKAYLKKRPIPSVISAHLTPTPATEEPAKRK